MEIGYMELTIWVGLGYIIGWIAPDILNISSDKGMLLSLIFGIIGSIIGGFLTNILISNFIFFSALVSAFGAIIFIHLGRKLVEV